MNKTKTDITHIFSTPIWTAIITNYEEININVHGLYTIEDILTSNEDQIFYICDHC